MCLVECSVCREAHKILGHVSHRELKRMSPEARVKFDEPMNNLVVSIIRKVCIGDPALPPEPPRKYIVQKIDGVIRTIINPEWTEAQTHHVD